MSVLFNMPLFWAGLTIGGFLLGQRVYQLTGKQPFLPPMLTGIILVITTLKLTDTSYEVYMTGGHYLHDLLGPVIVMLAVPLFQQLKAISQNAVRILLAVTLGSATTIFCAWGLAYWWIGEQTLANTLLTKSITTPVAVAIVPQLGGEASLAAGFVILTGMIGVIMIIPMLSLLKMNSPAANGITLGVCAHAIGTARALELGEQESAYAASAMTLTATLHAVVLPLLAPLVT
ncbi:MAG: hypothetical protein CMI09_04530 [Oceanospirillaceae bacterium]|nr:hypothetical protein [Oceanospirillaceae bacterium]|tara:strand:+ start:813 stop:1508 length:696 start_codon:yes stop_codon:yes gene_type:complete